MSDFTSGTPGARPHGASDMGTTTGSTTGTTTGTTSGTDANIRQAGEDLRVAARQAKDAASQAASTVATEAQAAAQTIKQEGAQLLGDAQQRAAELAQQGQQAGAEQVDGLARAIHRAASELEDQSPELGRVVHDAAGAVDRVARALRDRSPTEMLRGVEDFARRQPIAFFGAAALAGFALARFARSSASHDQSQGYATNYGGQRSTTGSGVQPQPMQHGTGGYGSTGYGTTHDTQQDLTTAGTSATGAISDQPSYPHGPSSPHDTASGAPGWVADESGTPRPATLASASLGGAVSYRPRGQTDNG